MPNVVAYLALLLWPLVSIALFRRLGPERGLIWSILGGYLVLPPATEFNLPLVPPLDKGSIPSIVALVICMASMPRWREFLPEGRLVRALMAVFVIGSIPTVLVNADPTVFRVIPNSGSILYKSWELPGLSYRDVISAFSGQLLVLIPFLLARRFLASETALRDILVALVVSALAYSLPALAEIRLSPQMNIWVYGFFQHDFIQAIRGGSFRPLVFLQHPLWLALFVLMAAMAATALARSGPGRIQPRYVLAALYLVAVLYLCKSLASQLYAMALMPLVFVGSPRLQLRVALALALVATLYPLVRGAGYVPVDRILEWAASIDPDRAYSLAYRFQNEDLLLQRASEKPFLGWGGWGRNLVHDIDTHQILTIPDGRWIITFGTYGWLGYAAEFGLLSLPVFLLLHETRRRDVSLSHPLAALALILGINMADLLVNATLTPITWLVVGAMLGRAEAMAAERRDCSGGRKRLNAVLGGLPHTEGPRTVL